MVIILGVELRRLSTVHTTSSHRSSVLISAYVALPQHSRNGRVSLELHLLNAQADLSNCCLVVTRRHDSPRLCQARFA